MTTKRYGDPLVNFRASAELRAQVERVAAERDMNLSEAFRWLIVLGIESLALRSRNGDCNGATTK